MGQKHDYKGYTFLDETAVMEDGYYRARVAVMTLGDGTRSVAKVHRSRNVPDGRECTQTSGRGSARMDR